ncbi:MAG: RDD family protein [Bryobacteraceae bacterium]
MPELPAQLRIMLPEGVAISLQLAGPATRMMAFMVDSSIIAAASSLALKTTDLVRFFSEDLAAALYILGFFLLYIGYGIGCEYFWKGQTLGKWMLGLRVMDMTGLELQFSQVVIRNLLRIFDQLPACGLVGGVAMLVSKHRQRLGDLAAGTVVVRDRRPEPKDLSGLARGRYNSFLQHQILCARVRKLVPPEAGAVAVEALMRRDSLDDRARVRLFDELAAYLQTLVAFPASETEAITSEQYVRNVMEILYFRSSKSGLVRQAPVAAALDGAEK